MFSLIINHIFTIFAQDLVWTPNSPWHFAPLFYCSLKSRTVTAIDLLFTKETSSKTILKDKSLVEVIGRFHGVANGTSVLTELDLAEDFYFVMATFQSHID